MVHDVTNLHSNQPFYCLLQQHSDNIQYDLWFTFAI